ncbi:hypothetical protein DRQ11_14665, partial [candidate division KSB1 bacterium]
DKELLRRKIKFFPITLGPMRSLTKRGIRLKKEIEELKKRIKELEIKAKEEEGKESEAIKIIEERLGTLSIHGGVAGYYQGTSDSRIEGESFDNPDGAGYVADLELSFEPIKNGEFYMRLHAGEGDGGDSDLEAKGGLFADLNTMNDDNPGDEDFDLLECYYTHSFSDGRFSLSIGKTEPLVFIDDNEFANDEVGQFVGKPFVNDPVLDSEDEYGFLVAFGYSPSDYLSLVVLYQSSSYPLAEEEKQKDIWEDIFNQPFFACQLSYSPTIKGFSGNYRFYGWVQSYDHIEIDDINNGWWRFRRRQVDTDEGWGIGISADQRISEKVGLFGRFGYHNEEVYEVPWFWSLGANITGLIPSRANDEIGFGVAGLKANDDLPEDDTEFHLEGYYKLVLSEHFAITSDFQYVANPLGNDSNDDVFAGMLRTEFSF